MSQENIKNSQKSPSFKLVIIAIVILITSGAAYKLTSSKFNNITNKPIPLPIPLKEFPKETENISFIDDIEIPEVTREYMEDNFADDYLSRRYVNNKTNIWFDLYVVFCSSKPSGLLGHRPRNCYKGHGWIHDETRPYEIITENNLIPCLFHRFHKPYPDTNEVVVLNYYIVNGQITNDESVFSSIWGRRPNISGDIARYVAQVQISSDSENSVIAATEEISDLILTFLPDTKNSESAYNKK